MCVNILSTCMSAPRMCLMSEEAGRGYWVHYRVTDGCELCVLGTEPKSSLRALNDALSPIFEFFML